MAELAKYLLDSMKSSIQTAADKTQEATYTILSYGSQYSEGKLREVMETENQKFLNELSQIKNNASALGVDINECLDGNEQELTHLPDVYCIKANQAVGESLKASLSVVSKAKTEIEQSAKALSQLAMEFHSCVTESPSTLKLSAIVTRIVAESTAIPVSLTKATYNVSKAIVKLPNSLSQDIVDSTREETAQAKQILARISACAEKKTKQKRASSYF